MSNRIKFGSFRQSLDACFGREAACYVDGVRVGFVSSHMDTDKHSPSRAIQGYSYFWMLEDGDGDRFFDFHVDCFDAQKRRIMSSSDAMREVKRVVLSQI